MFIIIRRFYFCSIIICYILKLSYISSVAAFTILKGAHFTFSNRQGCDYSASRVHFNGGQGELNERIKIITKENPKFERKYVSLSAKKESKFKNFEEFLVQQQSCSNKENNDSNDSCKQPLAVVIFSSPFCGPCVRMKDELMIVKKELSGDVFVVTIDSNKYPSLSCRYNVTGEKTYYYYFL